VRAQDDGNPSLYRDESFTIDVLDGNDRPFAIQVRSRPTGLEMTFQKFPIMVIAIHDFPHFF
jgi:hypothetical protein